MRLSAAPERETRTHRMHRTQRTHACVRVCARTPCNPKRRTPIFLQAPKLLRRLRALSAVSVLQEKTAQAQRIDSCTYKAAAAWCESHERFLVKHGFADDTPVLDAEGNTLEHVTVPRAKRRRILNSDEKQIKISNEGDKGGSRSRTYSNAALPRVGKRTSTVGGHATLHAWSNAGGEAGPIHVNLSSEAKEEADRTANLKVIAGLPEVEGIFGFHGSKRRRLTATFNVSAKGSTDDENFMDFIEQNVVPCYEETLAPAWKLTPSGEVLEGPVLYRTDFGPGSA